MAVEDRGKEIANEELAFSADSEDESNESSTDETKTTDSTSDEETTS